MHILSILTVAMIAAPAFAEDRQYHFNDFTGIQAQSDIKVHVTAGTEFSITAEAKLGSLSRLRVNQEGEMLFISRRKPFGVVGLQPLDQFIVHVSLPHLVEVEARSGAQIEIKDATGEGLKVSANSRAYVVGTGMNVARVDAQASSDSHIMLSGKCGEFAGQSSTGALLEADHLVCEDVAADSSGGSNLSLHGTETARLGVSTGATIELFGSPEDLETDMTSGGSIRY